MARDQRALMYSAENRPPTSAPKNWNPKYINSRASRKLGVASPMKPNRVTV